MELINQNGFINQIHTETAAKLRLLSELIARLKIKSSKYFEYSCGLNYRLKLFKPKSCVLLKVSNDALHLFLHLVY